MASARTRIHSFSPLANPDARILILGSMPGRASLAAYQYYAHPQNSFWRIMAQLLHTEATLPYEQRVDGLTSAGIAVWDVLQSCFREGSLDAKIESDTLLANDFRSFFQTHPKISHVFFNGAKAEACFRRHVLHELEQVPLVYLRLPSTSPANAGITYASKLKDWQSILPPLMNHPEPLSRPRK